MAATDARPTTDNRPVVRTELFRVPLPSPVAVYAALLRAAARVYPTMMMTDRQSVIDADGTQYEVFHEPPPIPATVELPWSDDDHDTILEWARDNTFEPHRRDDELLDDLGDPPHDLPRTDVPGHDALSLYVQLNRARDHASRPFELGDQADVDTVIADLGAVLRGNQP